jgi:hypothetical protein
VFPNPDTDKPLKHFHNTWDRIRCKAGGCDNPKLTTCDNAKLTTPRVDIQV